MCKNEESSISIQKWAKQSYTIARQISSLVKDGMTDEHVEEIQQLLLHQVFPCVL